MPFYTYIVNYEGNNHALQQMKGSNFQGNWSWIGEIPEWLTENELSDFSRLWHDGCVKATIEAQDVDRNHSSEV